jgi:hypothetical protein
MELLLEAERRGILPNDKKMLLEEARNRGIVPKTSPKESTLKGLTRTFLREGLPFAGALGGGAIGLAGGPAGVVAGAGLGAAGMKAGAQSIEDLLLGQAPGEQPQTMLQKAGDVAMTGISAAAGEGGGQVFAKGVEKVLAPVAGKVTASGRALLDTLNKKNMPVSPDVITDAPLTRWVRKLLDVPGTPGNFAANRQRGKLAKVIMDARNEFIEDTLKMPKASREVAAELKAVETAAYDDVAKMAGGKETRYAVKNLQEFLNNDALKLTGSSELKDVLVKARKEIAESGTLDFGMIQDLMAKKYKNFGKLGEEQKWVREALKSALEKDIAVINEATDNAVKFAQDKAKQATINKATANASVYIESLLSKATKYDINTGETTFHPAIFKDTIDKAIPMLKKRLPYGKAGEEKIRLIQKFADEMMGLSTDLSRKAATPKLNMFEKLATGSGALAFAGYNPATAAAISVPAGFQAVLANSMMKPNGVVKKWLTTGIKSPLIEEMTRAGAKGAALKFSEAQQ